MARAGVTRVGVEGEVRVRDAGSGVLSDGQARDPYCPFLQCVKQIVQWLLRFVSISISRSDDFTAAVGSIDIPAPSHESSSSRCYLNKKAAADECCEINFLQNLHNSGSEQ